MPSYWPLRHFAEQDRDRVVDRLLALRQQLKSEVPAKRDGSLLLATWNIRDFDSNKFGHGPRLPESYHYIAEIIAAFDLVAVQEVNDDMAALDRLMKLLGPHWDYIVTDTTDGPGGNGERLAFLFDRRSVAFRNIAGEIVLKTGENVMVTRTVTDKETGEKRVVTDALQFARTPFMVAFQAGWFKFNLCTVHIYFGKDSGAKLKRRIDEIHQVARFFKRRQEKASEDYILLGDFNIVSPEHKTMQALRTNGFVTPKQLRKDPSNLKGTKHYDQIALRVREKRLEIGNAGVFNFEKSVFRKNNDDFATYFDRIPPDKRDFIDPPRGDPRPRSEAEKKDYYIDDWRTWQMSDHLPMWVELKVDFTDAYLGSLRVGEDPLT